MHSVLPNVSVCETKALVNVFYIYFEYTKPLLVSHISMKALLDKSFLFFFPS